MELFDLSPSQNPDLAQQAAATADRLQELRERLCGFTKPAPPKITDALEGAISEFSAAATEGVGLATLDLDSARLLENELVKLCNKRDSTEQQDRELAQALERKRQDKVDRLRREGDLVKPFRTIWAIPFFSSLEDGDKDLEVLEWLCETDNRIIGVLLRLSNGLRCDLMAQGVFDTSMIRPQHCSFGCITGSILRYARDMWAEDKDYKQGNPNHRRNRIEAYSALFDDPTLCYQDLR